MLLFGLWHAVPCYNYFVKKRLEKKFYAFSKFQCRKQLYNISPALKLFRKGMQEDRRAGELTDRMLRSCFALALLVCIRGHDFFLALFYAQTCGKVVVWNFWQEIETMLFCLLLFLLDNKVYYDTLRR